MKWFKQILCICFWLIFLLSFLENGFSKNDYDYFQCYLFILILDHIPGWRFPLISLFKLWLFLAFSPGLSCCQLGVQNQDIGPWCALLWACGIKQNNRYLLSEWYTSTLDPLYWGSLRPCVKGWTMCLRIRLGGKGREGEGKKPY